MSSRTDFRRVAVERQGVERRVSIPLSGIPKQRQEKLETRLLPGRADRLEENGHRGRGPGTLKDLDRLRQAGCAESEGGLFHVFLGGGTNGGRSRRTRSQEGACVIESGRTLHL